MNNPCSISLVIPCLNEASVIGEFVDWCHEGLRKVGRPGQILIMDASSDGSAEIARQHGAEVVQTHRLGLGQAYIDSMPYIKGQYVIMGDCDLTYDFRDISGFVEKLDGGADFVMGSRLSGSVESGAMPALHRYFGTPVTTWILNAIYRTHFTDIHCGMRAMTREALQRIQIESPSWEYASEMVLKSGLLKLRTAEVPINFLKDRPGRLSHHRRKGWISPWIAGWSNLSVMFIYSPDFFLLKPGTVLLLFGLILSTYLSTGPKMIGYLGLRLHWMLLGISLATIGYSAVQLGLLSRIYYNFDAHFAGKIRRWFTYNRGVLAAVLLAVSGFALVVPLVLVWLARGLRLSTISYESVFGLLLLVFSIQTFTFTLLVQMMSKKRHGALGGHL